MAQAQVGRRRMQVGAGFCNQVTASVPRGVRLEHIRLLDEVGPSEGQEALSADGRQALIKWQPAAAQRAGLLLSITV
jgi:hypothetical protein